MAEYDECFLIYDMDSDVPFYGFDEVEFKTKAEQTYFAIRGGKAKRVDAASVVEAASVCGGKSHFAAKLRICLPRHAAIRDMMPSRCAS
ncbi:hypothetical protein DPMN_052671 [Dreissena polymorpha]|uniref:Uncharacterized protein n=1 Tax=Dreissena polymorpha TaxID=45954 RepID=A0A9D4CMD6_DREPO|nr:hypothetical protein DPMN_052671 [Dreissena polymorpha]